jgi:hypothetical protein
MGLLQEHLGLLQESLRNAEDKLEAAESCKKMLNEEVLTWKQAYEKMSSDLEASGVIWLTRLILMSLLCYQLWIANFSLNQDQVCYTSRLIFELG